VGARLLLQKSNEAKSKVHLDVVLGPSSSVRPTSSKELSPHSVVLEGLMEGATGTDDEDSASSPDVRKGSGRAEFAADRDPDLFRESDVNSSYSADYLGSSGNTLSVEVGFETRADMESWVAALQGKIDCLMK
jgi:hypothetical protein